MQRVAETRSDAINFQRVYLRLHGKTCKYILITHYCNPQNIITHLFKYYCRGFLKHSLSTESKEYQKRVNGSFKVIAFLNKNVQTAVSIERQLPFITLFIAVIINCSHLQSRITNEATSIL